MQKRFILVVILLMMGTCLVAGAQTSPPTPTPEPVALLVPEIVNEYPHDAGSFTQGLLLYDGFLYESAGQEGESDVRKVDIETGEVLQQADQADDVFSEGLALVDDRLVQLTWKHETAFVYDLETFALLDELPYTGEGWGLCYDGEALWMSDGTEKLTVRDPETFEIIDDVTVTYQGYPVSQIITQNGSALSRLNELECVGESIYANVWYTDYILQIDAGSGAVTGVVNAADLLTPEERVNLASGAVLNGIAYNPESETFYLTGKRWPKLFEVRLVEATPG